MTEKAIVTDFEEAVNTQLIEPFVNANFPPEKRRAAYLKMDPLDWNRKIALNLLRSKLWLQEQAKAEAKKRELKGKYRPASWGTQIRSYVLHPYKMVKDLRTEVETSNTEAVLDGDLDQFIEAELKLPLKK